MENRDITDEQITASSEYDSHYAAIQGRLNFKAGYDKPGAWSAGKNDLNQWLQIDLSSSHVNVTGVATQGRDSHTYGQWVKKYKLQYGNDGKNFEYYREQGKTTDKVK